MTWQLLVVVVVVVPPSVAWLVRGAGARGGFQKAKRTNYNENVTYYLKRQRSPAHAWSHDVEVEPCYIWTRVWEGGTTTTVLRNGKIRTEGALPNRFLYAMRAIRGEFSAERRRRHGAHRRCAHYSTAHIPRESDLESGLASRSRAMRMLGAYAASLTRCSLGRAL